jgi:hypothetical protein
MKHAFLKGLILGPLLFIIYISDLPLRINSLSKPILFAGDTSVIILNKSFEDFSSMSNLVLSRMTKWLAANNLALYLDKNEYNKIHYKEFITFCHTF